MEKTIEKIKESRPWIETAIILAAIGMMYFALKTEIGAVRMEIAGVNSRIDDIHRTLSRQDSAIRHNDKQIDDLKNSLLSESK